MNNVLEILNILNDNGYEAYIVGGYVRDYLLNIKSTDFDICTNAHYEDLKNLFNVSNYNYGSFKINYKNNLYEVTTFRKDLNYINNRKPEKIEYVNSLYEDLQRRDFTINTICMDKNKNIIDLLNGRNDLKNKIIKVVGDTDNKIKEDALRILRAIRIATILNFKLDNSLYNSIKKYGYLIKNLSYFRKRQELDKIFLSNNIDYGIKLLKDLELDKYLEIDLNFKKTNLYGIWAQINNIKYPFTKKELNLINNYKNTYL